ncbi:MAG: tetratricopeptide repeat protein [Elusimicrobia bacterium]|nr:tetratricopeptide repeat protein [Elusimicrobiota bacterium]
MDQVAAGRAGPFSTPSVRLLLAGVLLAWLAVSWRPVIGDSLVTAGRPFLDRSVVAVDAGEHLIHGLKREWLSVSMPMYPVLSALLRHHAPPWALPLVGWLVWLLPAALAFNLGRLLHSAACGLLAGCLVLPLAMSGEYLEESCFSVLVLLVANVAAWRPAAPAARAGALAGLAVGLSLLCRSTLCLYPLLLCASEWAFGGRGAVEAGGRASRAEPAWGAPRPSGDDVGGRGRWKGWLLLVAVPALVLAPWIVRNRLAEGGFVPFEQGRSDSIVVAGALGFVEAHEGDYHRLIGAGLQDSVLPWAAAEVIQHPWRFAHAWLLRLLYILSLHPALFLFGGLAVLLGRRRQPYLQVGFLAGYLAGMHSLLVVMESYFIPLWPLLATLAAGFFAESLRPLDDHPARRAAMGPAWACLGLASALGLYLLAVVGAHPWRAAGDRLEAALESHQGDAWLRTARGRRHGRGGDGAAAVRDFAKALALAPSADAQADYAGALLARGGPAEGLIQRVPLRGFVLTVMRGRVLRTLGLLQAGREEDAAREFEAVCRLVLRDADFVLVPRQGRPSESEVADKLRLLYSWPLVTDSFINELPAWPARRRAALMARLDRLFRLPAEPWLKAAEDAARAGDRDAALAALAGARRSGLDEASSDRVTGLYAELKMYPDALASLARRKVRRPEDAGAFIALAKKALASGDRRLALKALDGAALAAPGREDALELASLFAGLGEFSRALAVLERSPQAGSEETALLVDLARRALAAGRREAALRALAAASRRAPAPDDACRMAAAYVELKEWGKALAVLEGSGPRPSDAGLAVDAARGAWAAGQREAASRALALARRCGPSEGDARRLAAAHAEFKEPGKALDILEGLARLEPGDVGLCMELADAALRAGERALALRSLAVAGRGAPDWKSARRMAVIYAELGETRKALAALELLSPWPRDARLVVGLARKAAGAGDRPLALKAADMARGMKPDRESGRELAGLYLGWGEGRKARGLLEELSREAGPDAGLLLDLADAAAELKDKAGALDALRRAQGLAPDERARGRAALLFQRLGEYEAALRLLDALVIEQPGQARYLGDRGVVRALLGMAGEAEADLKAAIGLAPDSMAPYLTLGGLYLSQGKREKALEVYDQALARTPSDDQRPAWRLIKETRTLTTSSQGRTP